MRFSDLKGRARLRGVIAALGVSAVLAAGLRLQLALAATPPATVNYQGVLRDQNDVPLTGTYDMVMRLMDAATAGNEILIDQHTAANANAVTVSGGLFSVVLGSGTIVDGSGPGTYTSLDAVFRDHGAVWLEIQVGVETLSPRTRFQSSAYALNAMNLAGHPDDYYVNTSSQWQTKNGELDVINPEPGGAAIIAQANNTGVLATGDTFVGVMGNSSGGRGGLFTGVTNGVRGVCGGPACAAVEGEAIGGGWYGVKGIGPTGGTFSSTGGSAVTQIASGNYGIYENGGVIGGRFFTLEPASKGIQAEGWDYGGWFRTAQSSSSVGVGVYSDGYKYGVQSFGGDIGGWFQGTNVHGIYATGPDHGVDADAGNYGGFFEANGVDSYGVYASGVHTGVWGRGNTRGGRFGNFSGANVDVGTSTHKIIGTGSVSFVQNHPADPSKVIVYAAPEGDEVAVYTRGSGRLVNGEARVKLGETFALVTNPDIGLTATATPHGEPVALAISEVSPGELVVRGPAGSRAEFDYMVWGLRIGFEEQSVIRPKKDDAKIPSMHDHEEFFKEDPSLRKHTALARFKGVEEEMHGRKSVDMARADRLRDAVGVYVYGDAPAPQDAGKRPSPMPASAKNLKEEAIPANGSAARSAETAKDAAGSPRRTGDGSDALVGMGPAGPVLDRFNREGVMEAGDVVSLVPEAPGSVRRSSGATDALVIGCVQSVDSGTGTADSPVATVGSVTVATSHVALCRVDASYGAIAVGDRLSLSPTPGAGMRFDPGAVGANPLGRAIDPLPSGIGLIRVLLGGIVP